MIAAGTQFGHREADGSVVDLFWIRGDREGEFRVEVEDRREGARMGRSQPFARRAGHERAVAPVPCTRGRRVSRHGKRRS